MPRKKATKITKKTTRTTRTKTVAAAKKRSAYEKFVDHLKLGESYTSLVLGIIAVIIGTVLLLSIVHSHQSEIATPEVTPTIAQSKSFIGSLESITPTISPAPQEQKTQKPFTGKTYTVAAGDNLWMIAEKVYGSGYNWVDIARANNLANPGDIHVGDKLKTPAVKTEIATVHTADDDMGTSTQTSITNETYTVVAGDTLWAIAVRAYGDGYQWVKIAKANNLSNPDIIHKDNVLKIPRR